jgi:hypothetical protein
VLPGAKQHFGSCLHVLMCCASFPRPASDLYTHLKLPFPKPPQPPTSAGTCARWLEAAAAAAAAAAGSLGACRRTHTANEEE